MDPWEKISALRRDGNDLIVVTIISVRGSVPGQAGAKAIVTRGGEATGNLGGGKVEAKAIVRAIELFEEGESCVVATWNLQHDVGMTCGGEMTFLFEKLIAAEPWHIVVFGAGHVSQALVPVLATLACRIDVIDTRPDWLARFSAMEKVTIHRVAAFEDGVHLLNAGSCVLSLTQGHACDRPVLRELLRHIPDIRFLGVIGSASKRAVLLRELRDDGISELALEKIICPVGLPIGSNDPAEIAISITAQLLNARVR